MSPEPSNVAQLNEWEGTFTQTLRGPGTLMYTDVFRVRFRGDLRKTRHVIHEPAEEPAGPAGISKDGIWEHNSRGAETISGPSGSATVVWSGGGVAPAMDNWTAAFLQQKPPYADVSATIENSKQMSVLFALPPVRDFLVATVTSSAGSTYTLAPTLGFPFVAVVLSVGPDGTINGDTKTTTQAIDGTLSTGVGFFTVNWAQMSLKVSVAKFAFKTEGSRFVSAARPYGQAFGAIATAWGDPKAKLRNRTQPTTGPKYV